MSASGQTYSVKSCGKAHPWCGACRPDIALKIGAGRRGRPLSAEHRESIGRAGRGRKLTFSTEHRVRLSAAGQGRPVSAETRAKIGAANSNPSEETRAKIGIASRNRSSEVRAKLSLAVRTHMVVCDGTCGRAVCTPVRSPTRIEDTLVNVLLAEFPEVCREQRFGPYRVDAYLPPPYHLAFEADGTYWHSSSKQIAHDTERAAYLLAEHGLVVVRLGERDLLGILNGSVT